MNDKTKYIIIHIILFIIGIMLIISGISGLENSILG